MRRCRADGLRRHGLDGAAALVRHRADADAQLPQLRGTDSVAAALGKARRGRKIPLFERRQQKESAFRRRQRARSGGALHRGGADERGASAQVAGKLQRAPGHAPAVEQLRHREGGCGDAPRRVRAQTHRRGAALLPRRPEPRVCGGVFARQLRGVGTAQSLLRLRQLLEAPQHGRLLAVVGGADHPLLPPRVVGPRSAAPRL